MGILTSFLSLFQGPALIGLLAATIRMATPLAFASMGQIFAQLSGILDLSVEGLMLMGAFFGFAGAAFTGNLWLGVLIGMIIAGLTSLLMAFLSVTLHANQTIVSIMIGLMLAGLVTFLNKLIFGVAYIPQKIEVFQSVHFPVLSDLPYIGPILFQQNILVYLAIILVPIVSIIVYRTPFGLAVRSAGEHPRAADSLGINVFRLRYITIFIGGLGAGLGGAFLSLGYLGTYTDIITSGRGWLAISLVFFGKWIPGRVAIGAIFFAFINAVQLRMQAIAGEMVAYQLLLMLPYLLCILVLTVIARNAGSPAEFAENYIRE
jgi:ABC-type uncharacterized transport system permease subunit